MPEPDHMRPGEIDARTFDWHLATLTKHFNVLPLHDAIKCLKEGCLPARAVSITFDDGYADNVEVALPILWRWQLPATFFVATGFLDGGCMWNDSVIEALRQAPGAELDLANLGLARFPISTIEQRRQAAMALILAFKYLPVDERDEQVRKLLDLCSMKPPDTLMMRSDQVRTLRNAGMGIGAHTVSHPILTRLDNASARSEIAQSKNYLEELIDESVDLFAYPNGKPQKDYNIDHVNIVRSLGFFAALSTAWGTGNANSDFYQLPRFCPWDRTPRRFVLRLLQNCPRPTVALS
jgi:peptidoglycan/xylan/chitin deacetylase (PgdA/CDA1 family)